jgi:NAD(P)H-flavin reductase
VNSLFFYLTWTLAFVYLFQILRCGPPPMNKAMAAHLDELNYTKEMQFQF